MVNICIDGNYIFHKTFGIFAGYGENIDPGEILKTKEQQSSFIRKVSTDLISFLKMLPTGGRLVFTADSRSWRKDVKIENGAYKTRIKDEKIDWGIFFKLIHSFGSHLEKNGFIFSKVEGAEGDDLLLFWSKEFNKNGENCIIVTGDKDLYQLVSTENGVWTSVWNNKSKDNLLTVSPNWSEDWLNQKEEVSIFNMGFTISPERDKIKTFLKKVEIQTINNKDFIFKKILMGDKGDSVPSVWDQEKSGKIFKFTETKAEAAYSHFLQSEWSSLKIEDMMTNIEYLSWLSGLVLKLSKSIDSNQNREKVMLNILRNFKLMWLNEKVIPEKIIEFCNDEVKRGISLERRSITMDRIKILEGSEWINVDYKPKGFDPFENFID